MSVDRDDKVVVKFGFVAPLKFHTTLNGRRLQNPSPSSQILIAEMRRVHGVVGLSSAEFDEFERLDDRLGLGEDEWKDHVDVLEGLGGEHQ